ENLRREGSGQVLGHHHQRRSDASLPDLACLRNNRLGRERRLCRGHGEEVMLIVITTTSSTDEAESLANGLVESRLAACVQILPQMTSIYSWEGKIEKDEEHLLLIKTLP